jgi:preprotein translocase subunit SecE
MATSQVETVSTTADKAKLGLAVTLVWLHWLGFTLSASKVNWLSGVSFGRSGCRLSLCFCLQNQAANWCFGRDSWREVKKVVWPARKKRCK